MTKDSKLACHNVQPELALRTCTTGLPSSGTRTKRYLGVMSMFWVKYNNMFALNSEALK
jgi:hypothetical protein